MNDTNPQRQEPRPARVQEYEDPHYHDDDEDTADEGGSRRRPLADRRQAQRKWPVRRHFED